MGSLLAYSGITTKVRAMESHLITENQFREMAALTSVPEAVEYLRRQHSYEDIFANLEGNALHRGSIEQLLALSQYHDFAKLYRFANLSQRKFLDLYFMHYEVAILKRCLRNVMGRKEFDLDLSMFQDFFNRHSSLDLLKLSQSVDLREFIVNLEGSPYYSLLSRISESGKPALFDLEMGMDLLYFKTIWKVKSKYLSRSEQDVLAKCYGSKLDLLNVQWIYRSNKYFRLPSADVYALLIPINYKLKPAQITSLVEAATIDEFYAALSNTYYGTLKVADLSEKPSLEDLTEKLLAHIYSFTSRKNPYSIASMNSYLYFKEVEIQKIITVIECIRYGLDSGEIIPMVVKK